MSDNGAMSIGNVTYIPKIGNSESSSPPIMTAMIVYIQRGIFYPPRRAHRRAPPRAMINDVLKIMSWTNGVSVQQIGRTMRHSLFLKFRLLISRGTLFAITSSHFYPLLPSTLTTSQLWSCHPAPTIACHFHAYKYPRYL